MSILELIVLMLLFTSFGMIFGFYAGGILKLQECKKGTLVIDSNDIEKDVFRLEVDSFDNIERMKYVVFKVRNIE